MKDERDVLLSKHRLDNKRSGQYRLLEKIKCFSQLIIGLLMIVLGMSMIILPQPRSFEIFTIFNFNADDGVTVMDIISLLIVFCGVYLMINSFMRFIRAKRV